MLTDSGFATLGAADGFSVFQFGQERIRFKAPYSLERYTRIKHWEHGYLVVDAKYAHNREDEEEYIDLVPILEALYFDPNEFLRPIKGVKLAHE